MRHATRIVAGCAAMLWMGTNAAAYVLDGREDDWPGRPTMVGGTAGYDAGVWSYTDYVYDDDGAGGYTYPGGDDFGADPRYGRNAADVVVLRITADADAVYYLVRLNTLLFPDTTVVALAIDTDGSDAGGGPWPRNAKLSSPGWELVITAWGTGGVVTFADGSEAPIEVVVDTDDNTMELAVPRALADPGTGVWRYHGAAGLWDAEAGVWAEATGKGDAARPNAYNLLFRNRLHDGGTAATDEETSQNRFQSARQRAALASGDITDFVRTVDFASIAAGVTEEPEEPAGDVHVTRIYASRGFPNAWPEGLYPSFSLEGFDIDGSIYNGRHQPYRLFVPASYREDPSPAPMIPLLHGWGGDHKGYNPANNAFWNDVVRANRVIVPKPFGAGQRVWYEHLGELDVLEVIRDVSENYAVDPDRVYLGGVSMGGLGTIKIAEAHPDVFAGILPSVPPMADRAMGYAVPAANDWDLVEHAESLRNVPVRNFTGTYDALVPAGLDSSKFCTRLKLLEIDHDCWRDVSQDGTHRSYEADRASEIAKLLAEHRRVRDPARVAYEVHPVWLAQAQSRGIDEVLRYDRAYWVSGITYAGRLLSAADVSSPAPQASLSHLDCRAAPGAGTCFGELDVRTFGRGDGDPVATPYADLPEPTLIRDGMVVTPGPAIPAENRFEARFANLAAFDLDLARMGLTLDAGEPLTASLVNGGLPLTQLRLGLVGPGEECAATLDGAPVATAREGDRLVLELEPFAGPQELEVTCAS